MPECQTNTSTQQISNILKDIKLQDNEELISFDVSSLYTNVPVMEAIETCAELLYSGEHNLPPVDKETFVTLAKISSCDVLMSTHNGYYRQIDGLAMGSPPAPHLANGWMSTHDSKIGEGAKIYARYMDDVIRDIKNNQIDEKLQEINSLHPSLKFTYEREVDGTIPFLDMKILNDNGKLSSTWYCKPSDTGLIMNYHALAPRRYKRSVVSGFVHRIHRSCSTWLHYHQSMVRAKRILERNQYPPAFYEPIIEQTLTNIIESKQTEKNVPKNASCNAEETIEKRLLFIQYRGKTTEEYARALHRCNAPCSVVMTLRKLKTVLPSLKPPVEKSLRSGIVYQISCTHCHVCYVGATSRHLITRFKEHLNKKQPVGKHLQECKQTVRLEDTEILASSSRGEDYLFTLEALWIREIGPTINTRDEYRRKELTIKL